MDQKHAGLPLFKILLMTFDKFLLLALAARIPFQNINSKDVYLSDSLLFFNTQNDAGSTESGNTSSLDTIGQRFLIILVVIFGFFTLAQLALIYIYRVIAK